MKKAHPEGIRMRVIVRRGPKGRRIYMARYSNAMISSTLAPFFYE